MTKRRAFTLIELIVVIAIIAIIAAILFPVFSSVKTQTLKLSWGENARQVNLGTQLYIDDYDQKMMLPRHRLDAGADASNDRTWVQSLLPYTSNFEIFFCPVDNTRPASTAIFDPDLSPGNPNARFYEQSQRTNLGYNYAYLAPIYRQSQQWHINARSLSEVSDPSGTLLYGDSAWKIEDGKAQGGGNYLIIPPCRFSVSNGNLVDSFNLNGKPNWQIFGNGLAWQSKAEVWEAQSGGLYPWFKDTITVAYLDGHIKPIPTSQATGGCDVKPNWEGYIYDPTAYIWDLR